jgi:hypothetical protein
MEVDDEHGSPNFNETFKSWDESTSKSKRLSRERTAVNRRTHPEKGGQGQSPKTAVENEDMKILTPFDRRAMENELWQNALRTIGPLEVSAGCAQRLLAWITMAVERMENEGRLAPHDVALAAANLRRFIEWMKTEAVFLGHADRLDGEVFQAVERQLERKGFLSLECLWPFWPNEFCRV